MRDTCSFKGRLQSQSPGRMEAYFSLRRLLWPQGEQRLALSLSEGILPLLLSPGPWHPGGHMAMDGLGAPAPAQRLPRVPGKQAGLGAGTEGA